MPQTVHRLFYATEIDGELVLVVEYYTRPSTPSRSVQYIAITHWD